MGRLAERYGPWAVITGASSGIGAEFARQVAEQGVHVVLVARRRARLEALASALEDMYRVEARVAPIDLTSDGFLDALAPVVADVDVGLLVHGAGFGTSGPFLDMERSVQQSMLHLNCRAPALLTHELARGMRERGRGGVIVVSSVMGFSGAPGWANYTATKGYDLLFAESIAAELKPYGVHVQALCPGATRTEFQATAGIRLGHLGPLEPFVLAPVDTVVRQSLEKLGRRVTVIPGVMNRFNVLLTRFLPRWLHTWIFGFMTRRFSRPL